MIESIGEEAFNFQDERFADIQMLRYRLPDFESLTIRQKTANLLLVRSNTIWT